MKRLLFILLFLPLFGVCQRKIFGIDKNNVLVNLPKLLIQTGNSLGYGRLDCEPPASCNIGAQLYAALNTHGNYTYFQTSVSGRTISEMTDALSAEVYSQFDASYSKIIVAAIEGTNTMQNSVSGADAYAAMMAYVNDLLDEDPRVCVMVYQCINATPSYLSEAQRVIYNNLLAGTTQTSRFKVAPITSIPELNDATAYLNTTYYNVDGIHLTPAGYNLLAAKGILVAKTFGFGGECIIIILLLAAAVTKAEGKIISMNQKRKAA